MDSDFEANSLGRLSATQRTSLLSKLAFRLVVWSVIGLSVGIKFIQALDATSADRVVGWLIVAITAGVNLFNLWHYGRDIACHQVASRSGPIRKYQRRPVRGPVHYCIKVEQHQLYNPELLTDYETWHSLEEGHIYALYYARNTRWLLSWREERMV